MSLSSQAGPSEAPKRIPACDTCKLRKLKCPRNSVDEVCSRCIDKCIRCTTTAANKPRKQRGGKRIDEARQTFGSAGQQNSPPTDSTPSSNSTTSPQVPVDLSFLEGGSLDGILFPAGSPADNSLRSQINSSNNTYEIINNSGHENNSNSVNFGNTGDLFQDLLFPLQSFDNNQLQLINNITSINNSNNNNDNTNNNVDSLPLSSFINFDLSPQSSNSQLAVSQITETLSSHLIETFFQTGHSLTNLIDWTKFQNAWEAAGRRPSQMQDPALQSLCYSMMSLGSRVSAHPVLLDTREPLIVPTTHFDGNPLNAWGLRRENICQGLYDRSVEIADEQKLIRTCSVESIAACSLLWELGMENEKDYNISRGFSSMVFQHMRTLAEKFEPDQTTKMFKTGFALHLIMRDLGFSAATGVLPNSTTDDIDTFLEPFEESANFIPTPQEIADAVANFDPTKLRVIMSIFHKDLQIKRLIFRKLSGPAARKKSDMDVEAIRDLWRNLDDFEKLVDNMIRLTRASPMKWLLEVSMIIKIDLCHSGATIYRLLQDRMPFEAREARRTAAILTELTQDGNSHGGNSTASPSYWAQVADIDEESRLRLFQYSLKVAHAAREILDGLPIFRSTILLKLVHVDLWLWIKNIMQTPSATFGGPAEYTNEEKEFCVKTLRDIVAVMGWSYASMDEYIKVIDKQRNEEAVVELKQTPEAFVRWDLTY